MLWKEGLEFGNLRHIRQQTAALLSPDVQQQNYPRQICLPSLIPTPPLYWEKSLCSWSVYRKSRLIWLGGMGEFYVLAVLILYLAGRRTKPAPQPISPNSCTKQRSVQGQEQAALLNQIHPRNKSCSSDADSPTHKFLQFQRVWYLQHWVTCALDGQ